MDHLVTEARNPASMNLDELTPLQLVHLMNAEDAKVIPAVAEHAEAIARAIEVIADRLRAGGRLIYAGAGTSGRLGVLDATECPPTFNSPPGQVVGLIAGGAKALTQAVEGAEDHPELAEQDLAALRLSANDVLVGIATSGRTPYVLGAVEYARKQGAFTIGLSCNPESDLSAQAELAVTVTVGPEVLSGSTRLKAGTATKLVLNMLSTGAMVRLGKTYGNLMVDLRATNNKLRARTNRIVRILTGLSAEEAGDLLQRAGGELKTALVAQLAQVSPEEAQTRLQTVGGQVRQALGGRGRVFDAPAGVSKTQPRPPADPDLVLGIDGGGSHTVALLARRADTERGWTLLGRGQGGPSNLQTVGADDAFRNLDQAVSQAFAAAGLSRRPVGAACLGMAGAGRAGDQEILRGWATQIALAGHVEVTTDAALLFAAGTPEGWGLAVVAGTGSIAVARSADGRSARAGGWGPLLGDEGSGYALAVAGLQAVAQAADGCGAATVLTQRLLAALGLGAPQELIPAVYSSGRDRVALAALAPLLLEAAADDAVAKSIVDEAAETLAETAVAAARQLGIHDRPLPVALAGSVLVNNADYRQLFVRALQSLGINAASVRLVSEPAEGAVRLAAQALVVGKVE
jgi:N-acetylmuramic acid 6-phosphate etherase